MHVWVHLSLAEGFADLKVELHEACAGLRKIPAGAHHSQTARLTQGLVPEVNMEQGLHGVILLTAEYVIRPQAPKCFNLGDGCAKVPSSETLNE